MNTSIKSIQLITGLVLAQLAVLSASVAYAQTVIEEIIVTAQKKEENVQDIGRSISVVDAEGIANAGIQDVTRLEHIMSGVTFGFVGGDAKINVRGANSRTTLRDVSATAGFFLDDVYRPRAAQQSMSLFDIERIEVLKGPQGTLYGRNTLTGAIKVYSSSPDLDKISIGLETTLARFSTVQNDYFINYPVNDEFGIRIAGRTKDSDGWIKNVGPGPNMEIADDNHVRFTALWRPSERFVAHLRIQSLAKGGTAADIFGGEDQCRLVHPSGLTDINGVVEDCENPIPGTRGTWTDEVLEPWVVSTDVHGWRNVTEESAVLNLRWDFENLSLISITSFSQFENQIDQDADHSPVPGNLWTWDELADSVTQELQFVSTGGWSSAVDGRTVLLLRQTPVVVRLVSDPRL